MPFWTGVNGTAQDPKRVSRFKVSIESLNNEGSVWYAKSFSKPAATVKTATHRYLNHSFYYPGSVEWNEVVLEMIDPTDPIDAAGSLANLLMAMGYTVPDDPTNLVNISKRKATTSLGLVSVSQIDDSGEAIETWTLQQPFVTKLEWGSYKYEGDDLNVLKLTLRYDWAVCSISTNDPSAVETARPQAEGEDGSYFVAGLVRPTTRT